MLPSSARAAVVACSENLQLEVGFRIRADHDLQGFACTHAVRTAVAFDFFATPIGNVFVDLSGYVARLGQHPARVPRSAFSRWIASRLAVWFSSQCTNLWAPVAATSPVAAAPLIASRRPTVPFNSCLSVMFFLEIVLVLVRMLLEHLSVFVKLFHRRGCEFAERLRRKPHRRACECLLDKAAHLRTLSIHHTFRQRRDRPTATPDTGDNLGTELAICIELETNLAWVAEFNSSRQRRSRKH